MSDITDQPGKSGQWVRRANVVMLAVVSILAGYVAVKYFTMSAEEEPAVAENDFQEEAPAAGPAPGVQAPPLDVYLAGIAQRNLFETPDPPAAAENTALPAALPDLESRIKLIGILVDRDSKAIVEDLQGHQTHFLSRGESIGPVLLEEIREDKVIFMYRNERFEMSLSKMYSPPLAPPLAGLVGGVRGGGLKKKSTAVARKLREESTEAEKYLWSILRRKNLGVKFRRQAAIGRYIVDFVCFNKRLVVEVDGGQHAENQQDSVRDEWLEKDGFYVMRFWNHEVLGNGEGVVEKIMECFTPSLSLPTRGRECMDSEVKSE